MRRFSRAFEVGIPGGAIKAMIFLKALSKSVRWLPKIVKQLAGAFDGLLCALKSSSCFRSSELAEEMRGGFVPRLLDAFWLRVMLFLNCFLD